MSAFTVRPAVSEDAAGILALHRKVAAKPGGLARRPDEVTADYVAHAMAVAGDGGVNLVAVDADGTVCGELHVERMKVAIFAHVLTDLTVAVDPDWQGRGVGSALFRALIDIAGTMTPPVGRIELWTGAANLGAQRLYQRLGFKIEGRMTGRGRYPDGSVDDDIVMGLLLD
ncbi:acetyltransferase [Caulobacter sp. Root487D2Y]|uniref:GNAT family N-acetyltransferase n=1 Tax=Caulobacter sp. Root487D2Y TaxID=1736547 RepID=UPI0006F39542|nr:GNAT family N-acetyltransferase [Caulobacter sp. Root487D2Y]KQY29814.1 acetyltransferase [Caulobacter sp. Root487D2Y]